MEKKAGAHIENNPLSRIFYTPVTAWGILGISTVLTVAAYIMANNLAEQAAKSQFEFRVTEIASEIEERLRVYESLLHGAAGLFMASDQVTRQEWKRYVGNLNINQQWPGVQALGYTILIPPEEKDLHIRNIREQGFPGYMIKPDTRRDLYSSIIYIEPFDWRNQRSFGYDMWSDNVRREAMSRARDAGEAATSGIVILKQETEQDIQKGFLTYLPIYKYAPGQVPETVDQRRKAFQGWVYAAFRAGDLMRGILKEAGLELHFEIFDAGKMMKESLLYSTHSMTHVENEQQHSYFRKTVNISLQGRPWTLYFHAPEEAFHDSEKNHPLIIVIGGLLMEALLFYVIYSIYALQRRAQRIADDMTDELQKKTNELETTKISLEKKVRERTLELEQARTHLEGQVQERTRELQQQMKELERINKTMVGRELKMIELKKEIKTLKE